MRAIVFDQPGDESVLRLGDAPSPELTPDGVRIAVTAAGVNRADLLQRRGLYPPPAGASPILGLECAGAVLAVGPEVESIRVGDRVMALLAGGGYADEVVAPADCVMPVPAGYSDAEAGGFPEAFVTAYLNLFELGGLDEGANVLVQGGSGGVGTAAIQLADAAGARVIVTAGSPERCRRCLDLGADVAVDYRREDLLSAVRAAIGDRGVDLVLDCVGAPYLDAHLRLLAPGGRLVLIGLMGGAEARIDLRRVLSSHIRLIGSTLRSRPAADKGRIIAGLLGRFGDAIAAGEVRPVIDAELPLAAAADAHRRLAAGEVFGKIVLSPTASRT